MTTPLKQISLTDPLSPLLPECTACLQTIPPGKNNETPPKETLHTERKIVTYWTQAGPNSNSAKHSPIHLEDNQWVERCASCQNTVPIGKGDLEKIDKDAWEIRVSDLNNSISDFLNQIKNTSFDHLYRAEEGKEQRDLAETWAKSTREMIALSEKWAQELFHQANHKDYDTKPVEHMINQIAKAKNFVYRVESFVQNLLKQRST